MCCWLGPGLSWRRLAIDNFERRPRDEELALNCWSLPFHPAVFSFLRLASLAAAAYSGLQKLLQNLATSPSNAVASGSLRSRRSSAGACVWLEAGRDALALGLCGNVLVLVAVDGVCGGSVCCSDSRPVEGRAIVSDGCGGGIRSSNTLAASCRVRGGGGAVWWLKPSVQSAERQR